MSLKGEERNMKKYKLVACGGTFDYFHKGHEAIIKKACEAGKQVVLGITTDKYVASHKQGLKIGSYSKRKKEVECFLGKEELKNVEIVPLADHEGLAVSSAGLQAIVATENTEKVAHLINAKRVKNGLLPLAVIMVPLVIDQIGIPISSTRIRNGEISRNGKSWVKKEWLMKNLILPIVLRQEFQKPWGEVVGEIVFEKNHPCITVGDITTIYANKHNIGQQLSVVDYIVERKKRFSSLEQLGFSGAETVHFIANPHGVIVKEMWPLMKKCFTSLFKNRAVILVNGEEDLCVAPLLLLAPLGYRVYYGQPNNGMVKVDVTEEMKGKVHELISQMKLL